MPSSPAHRAEHARRSRLRGKLLIQAEDARYQAFDALLVTTKIVNGTPRFIIFDVDGKRAHEGYLAPAPDPDAVAPVVAPLPVVAPVAVPGPEDPRPTKRVYAPKTWNATIWNDNRVKLIEAGVTREAALSELARVAASKTDDPDAQKKFKQARAVFDAMPDVPDWATHLPVAPVE